MRVPSSSFDQLAVYFRTTSRRLTEAAERLSSGKRISSPSDDVSGLSEVLHDRVSLAYNAQFQRNVESARQQLERIDMIMSSATDALAEVRETVRNAAVGLEPSGSDSTAASRMEVLRDQILSLANSNENGASLFSGFKTDLKAFDPVTFAYQGDEGMRNTIVDGARLSTNLPGSLAFGYSLTAESVVTLSDGSVAHYIPQPDSSVKVEIRSSDDTALLDSFTLSNSMQIADEAVKAVSAGDRRKAEALLGPLDRCSEQMQSVRIDIGVKMQMLKFQEQMLNSDSVSLNSLITRAEDADSSETAIEVDRAELAFQAVRQSAAKIFSKTLFDFLR